MSTTLEHWAKIVPLIIAALTFAWGVYLYFRNEKARQELSAQEREAEADRRRIEATKPFLERQLQLYQETICIAAVIATSSDPAAVDAAIRRFWELYWGELALVEDQEVACAMEAFGKALKQGRPRETMELLSLVLAHSFRRSLSCSWGTPAWDSDHPTPAEMMLALDDTCEEILSPEATGAGWIGRRVPPGFEAARTAGAESPPDHARTTFSPSAGSGASK